MERKLNSIKTKILVLLFAGVFSLLLQETLGRGGLKEALEWSVNSPHLALANLVIITSLIALISALIGRILPGTIISFLILLLVSIVNYGKIVRLHQPLFPWDIWNFKQVLALLPCILIPEIVKSFTEPMSAALFVLLCVLVSRERCIRLKGRIAMFLAAAMVLLAFVYHRELPWDTVSLLSTENAVWDQRSNYQRNGFLLAFSMNLQPIFIDKPEAYCDEAIQELLKDVVSDEYESSLKGSNQPISLVLFVSESFNDLMHVAYEADEDPLSNFRRLQTVYPSFRMISPTFGGNTSNVEFEILTGFSNAFLPVGAIPYDQYIKQENPSIASILKNSGYRTVAIHPYHEWFWNRCNVYPLIGFEEFITLKEFKGAKQRGWFISDEALVDKVIDRIEAMGDSPFFVYALSMQNHGEYDPNRYAPDEVELRAKLPENLKLMLKTYVSGLRDADRQLLRLLRYLESRSEPIVTLFCGDHLPTFGAEYALYRESGVIQSDPGNYSLEDYFNMASVPCLIWANREDLLNKNIIPEFLSPIYFPPLLLRQLGVKMPGHIRYLYKGIEKCPVIHRKFVWQKDGGLLDFLSEKESSRFLQNLEMLQYDILLGDRYSFENAG
ncbi:MAG: LTA synthase family protein [Syntrophobacteraceae bacterium]